MGFDLEKRLASELNRLAGDAQVDKDLQRPKQVERLKQIADDLKARLAGATDTSITPGKQTEVDHVVASALRKLESIADRARRFDAQPRQPKQTPFER
jgi:hypothetical protein